MRKHCLEVHLCFAINIVHVRTFLCTSFFERIPDPDAAKLRARLDLLAVCPHILSKKAIV